MPLGRKPTGERALTGAERQARYRAARAGQPDIRYPRRTRPRAKDPERTYRRSRPQRWRDAIAELLTVQADCAAWLDKLPEATQRLGNWRAALAEIEPTMMATWQWLRPLHSRLTRQSTRDITPTTRWVTPPRPPSDRNGGRFEIGMGGRFQIGNPGRLHRNPQEERQCPDLKWNAQIRCRQIPKPK